MSGTTMSGTGEDRWSSGDLYEPYVGRWSRLVAREFLDWLDDTGERPFFAFLNYFDAHFPFDAPPSWAGRFGPRRETLGLVGESGSGKTLTGLAILGLLQESPMHGYELRKELAAKLGAITAGVNNRLTSRERDAVLALAEPRLVITELGAFEPTGHGFRVIDLAPGVTRDAAAAAERDINRIVLPPANFLHEVEKVEKRWPAAVAFVRDRKLNECFGPEDGAVGILEARQVDGRLFSHSVALACSLRGGKDALEFRQHVRRGDIDTRDRLLATTTRRTGWGASAMALRTRCWNSSALAKNKGASQRKSTRPGTRRACG